MTKKKLKIKRGQKRPKLHDQQNKYYAVYIYTSIERSSSFSADDFPCPLISIATTRAFSLIILAANANESLAKVQHEM